MAARGEFRQALIDGDFRRCAAMWRVVRPHLPQPNNDGEAEIQMHAARTCTRLPLKLRAYSHRWLTERNLPSLLPDHLRPKAEQLCPKVVPAVGFAWGSGHTLLQPAKPIIEGAVHKTISELAADGMLDRDPGFVRNQMLLTKNRTIHALFGRIQTLLKEGLPA